MPPKKTTTQVAAATPAVAAPASVKQVAAPAAAVAATPAKKAAAEAKPAATKKADTKADAKSTTTTAAASTSEVKADAAPAAATTSSFSSLEELEQAMAEESTAFTSAVNQLISGLNELKTKHKANEKRFLRELKNLQKQSSKKKRKAGNRSPSGFVKPAKISDELAKFLGRTSGTEMARTEVTREITSYIKTNNLKDATNGRKINPDTKLTALLKLKKEDELTYFNLQKYLSCHFPKTPAAAVTATA